MPSRNTEILSLRIRSEVAEKFKNDAASKGFRPSEYFEHLMGYEKGVTPDEIEVSDTFEYEELGFDRVLRLLRKKNYPDRAIQKLLDGVAEQVMEAGDYNPRRAKEDWC
jgi:hypothetical protein